MNAKVMVFVIATFVILCITFDNTSYAVSSDMECAVRIYGATSNNNNSIPPVSYKDNQRSNPDGSMYPGDALHFLFRYSGSDTCISFALKPLVGSKSITFESALVLAGDDKHPRAHNVISYQWVPKHLKTFHYYTILDTETSCVTHRGGKQTCSTEHTLSENPILSIRQDQKMTRKEAKLVNPPPTCYFCAKVYKNVTESWHLVQNKTAYKAVDRHILEDKDSADTFVDFVRDACSNLSKHQGCLFGHAEVNTNANNKQICLFEELDKLDIKYDSRMETDHCIKNDLKNTIKASVIGTGRTCDGDGKCTTFTRHDDDTIALDILDSYGKILFDYLRIYDSDGFYFGNNDGTYYLNDVIGIHAIPDVTFKDIRADALSFDGMITNSTITKMYEHSCNGYSCDVVISGDTISANTYDAANGDIISTHHTDAVHGLAVIHHESKMYNLDRYIGVYSATAAPLVVCYDPVISQVLFWSYLADAGNSSFDNRYAAAIKYEGSVGGCADDTDKLHTDRRIKINDFDNVLVQGDNFGKTYNVTRPDLLLSDGSSIADMRILDSVRDMIGDGDIVSDSFAGPVLAINHTAQAVQIDSAGFSRLLFDVDIDEGYLERNYVNVTSYNILKSLGFGGADVVYLAFGTYEYPWGFFSTPFNVTAYRYVSDDTSCNKEFCVDDDYNKSLAVADTNVVIDAVSFADSSDLTSISLVDFYLNHHKDDDEEFAFMHLADLYEMNIPQHIQSHTGEFLLNKTAIYYDKAMQDYLFETDLYGDNNNNTGFSDSWQYLINQSPQIFHEGPYYTTAEISATRYDDDAKQITNIISFDVINMQHAIKYHINMNPQNHAEIHRTSTAVSIPHYLHFGKIANVTINGNLVKNISCDKGCMMILPNKGAIDITVNNVWGGKIVNQNLTSIIRESYDESIWVEHVHARLFWILVALAVVYVLYRVVRAMFTRR